MLKRAEQGSWIQRRDALLLAWIACTGLFFFLRFSVTFYSANELAIRRVVERLFP